jgi:hypothetical protein
MLNLKMYKTGKFWEQVGLTFIIWKKGEFRFSWNACAAALKLNSVHARVAGQKIRSIPFGAGIHAYGVYSILSPVH